MFKKQHFANNVSLLRAFLKNNIVFLRHNSRIWKRVDVERTFANTPGIAARRYRDTRLCHDTRYIKRGAMHEALLFLGFSLLREAEKVNFAWPLNRYRRYYVEEAESTRRAQRRPRPIYSTSRPVRVLFARSLRPTYSTYSINDATVVRIHGASWDRN